MQTLPVRKIPSVGGMTETTLKELDIETGKDLFDKAHELMIAYSDHPKMYEFLLERALGIGRNTHSEEEEEQKGISVSETFNPLKTKDQFKQKISEISNELSLRMQSKEIAGLIVGLQIKLTNFDSFGKQMKQ